MAKPLRGFVFKKAAARLFILALSGPESETIDIMKFMMKCYLYFSVKQTPINFFLQEMVVWKVF